MFTRFNICLLRKLTANTVHRYHTAALNFPVRSNTVIDITVERSNSYVKGSTVFNFTPLLFTTTDCRSVRHLTTSTVRKESFNVQDAEDFRERVMKSSVPVIVDFHASWCGPCKILGPRLETIVASKGNKVHLAKVDIDSNTDLAMEYNVTAVPAVVGMINGEAVDQFVGIIDDDQIHSFVDKLIGPST